MRGVLLKTRLANLSFFLPFPSLLSCLPLPFHFLFSFSFPTLSCLLFFPRALFSWLRIEPYTHYADKCSPTVGLNEITLQSQVSEHLFPQLVVLCGEG